MSRELTNEELLESANDLARLLYRLRGYDVPRNYRFDRATHPQEVAVWSIVVIAYEHIEGTDLEEVIAELEE